MRIVEELPEHDAAPKLGADFDLPPKYLKEEDKLGLQVAEVSR